MNHDGPISTLINFLERKIQSSPLETSQRWVIGIVAVVFGTLSFSCFIVFILPPLLIKALWDWTVPVLFPGAVAHGDLAGIMPFWTAFRVLLILLLLASFIKWIPGQLKWTHSQPKKGDQQASIVTHFDDSVDPLLLPAQPSVLLTDKESDIARFVADGLTNKQIANQMELSERTIEFHLNHIFQKLRVGSRVEVAIWSKKNNEF